MITQRHNPAYRPADLNPGMFAGVFYFSEYIGDTSLGCGRQV